MCAWNGHGLRGSMLEDIINRTNESYRVKNLCVIQKIPTPITPVEMNKKRQITLAYFDMKSTVDYIGTVQGIPVCFDAKECATDTFPLQNIHEHQISFMHDFERQQGVAFLIVYYTVRDEMYYIPFRDIYSFWERMESGGRKSFRYEEVDKSYKVERKGEFLCHYLEALDKDLRLRKNI
ncbi:MAG: Holliday junction resolvase RecU [Eubacteriales bacterium]|nr:Holliday junction resolvase RecU [Eubacteriales bacterium]